MPFPLHISFPYWNKVWFIRHPRPQIFINWLSQDTGPKGPSKSKKGEMTLSVISELSILLYYFLSLLQLTTQIRY